MNPDPRVRLIALLLAVRRFERAAVELRRALALGEQPRLSKAGTRYHSAKVHLFKVAAEARSL